MKTSNSAINVVSSIFGRLVALAFGVIIPKLLILRYGSEVNGLLSSVAGIFNYLNLLEAGIGAASIQALYKPLSQKDDLRSSRILAATRFYYRKVGLYFLAAALLMAWLYPLLIKSGVGAMTVTTVILLSAVPIAVKYTVQGKYVTLLIADNRGYVLTMSNTVVSVLIGLSKILLIYLNYSIIWVQLTGSVITLLQVLIVLGYVKKHYRHIDLRVVPDTAAISQKSSVVLHQLSGTLFANTDVIVLSLFSGLEVVSVYTIYNMIYSQVASFPGVLVDGTISSLGQLYHQNYDRFRRVFNCFEVFFQAFVFAFLTTTYILVIPFLDLYLGKADFDYGDNLLVLLFTCVHLLISLEAVSVLLIRISGHFRQTRMHAVAEAVLNLVLSLILGKYLGIYGVVIATIVSLCYRAWVTVMYVSGNLLNRSKVVPFRRWVTNLVVGLLIVKSFQKIEITINGYIAFFKTGLIVFGLVSSVYLLVNIIIEREAGNTLSGYSKVILHKVRLNLGIE